MTAGVGEWVGIGVAGTGVGEWVGVEVGVAVAVAIAVAVDAGEAGRAAVGEAVAELLPGVGDAVALPQATARVATKPRAIKRATFP